VPGTLLAPSDDRGTDWDWREYSVNRPAAASTAAAGRQIARLRARGPWRAHRSLGDHEGHGYGPVGPGGYGFKPGMTWEFLSVAMTAVPRGAVGELNQNGAPPAICPGVQMNCLVIMKVQAGFCTQARTPVRSA
jgi:hypothetical protein